MPDDLTVPLIGSVTESRQFTCWCDSGDCDKPTDQAFSLCQECLTFGHRLAPRMGLTADDLWPVLVNVKG